jgi:tRNA (guanine-N7-)-methyltransferase
MRRFDPTRVPRPSIDFDFQKTRFFDSIDLEIGSGVGRFAIQRAMKHPMRAMIAIEKTNERYTKFATRVKNHPPMPNLFPLHGEAASVITHFIPEQSLDSIFILYPNPYPKLKQRNLRWHNRAFMGYLLQRLRPEGQITIATNIEDYYLEALQMMEHTWHLNVIENRKVRENELPRTHFEKKYLDRDENCWNLVFKKP